MTDKNLNIAITYYTSMNNKKFEEMASCLHSDIHFIGLLSVMDGKESVVEAAKNFAMFFKNLTISENFSSNDKVMLALEFDCPAPIGIFRGASLLSFNDGLISRIELFYDARPFVQKKEEIFN
ncbi:nuclear transport factor 2 family protein [Rickettsia endosymbiont of Rhinocyllus conicus]|uniref:nuclear transport factor 2 family protein n=1 Tax=Rickettsia endosymbiont of Rhinocyllus conicus TaxID=3066252 RepID=UPI003132A069